MQAEQSGASEATVKTDDGVEFGAPEPAEGADMWRVARDSGGLELNTLYAYLLLSHHFQKTCCVARFEGEVVGYVGAYLIPARPDTVFVWQIGVDAKMRGRGLGKRLLHALVELEGCKDVHFLETTVTPDNTASRRLFAAFAREQGCPIVEKEGFPASIFKFEQHEAEDLFRIGPFGEG